VHTLLIQYDPGFAKAHECLAFAYWGKRMYPQAIAEFKSLSRLNDDETQVVVANALEEGFHSSGWNGALAKAAQASATRRKGVHLSAYGIVALYADRGDKEEAFR